MASCCIIAFLTLSVEWVLILYDAWTSVHINASGTFLDHVCARNCLWLWNRWWSCWLRWNRLRRRQMLRQILWKNSVLCWFVWNPENANIRWFFWFELFSLFHLFESLNSSCFSAVLKGLLLMLKLIYVRIILNRISYMLRHCHHLCELCLV